MFGKFWKDEKNTIDSRLSDHELTYREIKDGDRRRLATIMSEFKHMFRFLKSYPRSVSFFGSSRFDENHPCYIRARALSKRIVEETGYAVVTGGGPGIMEAANRGAYEAGGKSLGMNIILPHGQKMNQYLTASMRFYYFFIRKVALSFSAEVYIFFPGGYGTMDEFFELMNLIQTRKIPQIPVICVGTDFWNGVKGFVGTLRDEFKTISSTDGSLFTITDSDEEIVKIVKEAKLRRE